jgi:hypothetical protein
MANTGTDVTRTDMGKRILTMIVKALYWFEAASVARMSDELMIWKLAAPVIPTIRYIVTQIVIEYKMTLCIETFRDNSFTKDGTVVICKNEHERQQRCFVARRTYKRKVVKHKANETALVAANGRDILIQSMFSKDDNPDYHYKEEGSGGGELEFDILNQGHH